jgi:hypothetical protein
MDMKQALILAGAMLLALVILSGQHGHSAQAMNQVTAPATLPPEIPSDTQALEFDKPLTDSLNPNVGIRFYTFTAKAGQLIRVSVDPKSGSFFTTLTIMSTDLDSILGGTIGETLVSGSVVVQIPGDGMYAISVEYADSTLGTPAPGSYEIAVSVVKPQ